MDKYEEYLFKLRNEGIDVEVDSDQLKLNGPAQKLTPEHLKQIKADKPSLLAYASPDQKQYYPLSTLQKRMCYSYFTAANNYTHHLYSLVTLNEQVDINRLQQCFLQLMEEHQILRTSYHYDDKGYYQSIWPKASLDFAIQELPFSDLENWVNAQAHLPMYLEKAQILRVRLAKTTDSGAYFLLVIVHHIACDFESLQLIFANLEQYYNRLPLSENIKLNQFKHIILNERRHYKTDKFNTSLHYWQNQIGSHQPVFSHLNKNEEAISFVGKSAVMIEELEPQLTQMIQETIKQISVTPHNFFLALFEILVAAKSKCHSFQVGIPISKRQAQQQKILGMFIDTYWVHADLSETPNFFSLSQIVKEKTLQILSYLDCGFYDLLELLNLQFKKGPFPVFQVSFNWVKSKVNSKNSLVKTYHGSKNTGFNTAPYDLMLVVSEEGSDIKILWTYNELKFSADDMKKMIINFKKLIQKVCNNPLDIPLHDLLLEFN